MRSKVVDPTYAKSDEYKKVINKIAVKGKCPFCPENFKYHQKPILKTQGNWLITKNSWPYKNCQHHLIIICKSHKENFNELSFEDFKAVQSLTNWAIQKYKIKGGGLTFRFGETRFTGATVCHLHFHLIVPSIDQKTDRAKTVNFPIG